MIQESKFKFKKDSPCLPTECCVLFGVHHFNCVLIYGCIFALLLPKGQTIKPSQQTVPYSYSSADVQTWHLQQSFNSQQFRVSIAIILSEIMIMKNRKVKKRRSSEDQADIIVDAELAKGKFSFIYRNSFQKEVRVNHCIPLFNSRVLCESGIRGLEKAFGFNEDGVIGYSHAGGLKVVVELPESELGIVKNYLSEQGKTESEAIAATYSQDIDWYGIVDGEHTHASLLRRAHARPDPFHNFKWVVTVIQWQSFSVLRAFSRARNQLQSTNIIEMTLFDTINGLHEIAQEKAQLAGDSFQTFIKQRGVITEISDEFCGGSKYSKQTTRTLTGAALRIKPSAMVMLGQIMTEEDPPLAKKALRENCSEVLSEEVVFDARVYRNIISTNTLRGATTFLNADERDQVNALLRLKFSYEDNDFKCFQASRLNKETERSERARHQIDLMNQLMYRDKWPDELADVQNKILTSSIFDSELDRYPDDQETIIPSLISAYRERMPLEAGLRWRLYCNDLARRKKKDGKKNTETRREQEDTDYNDGNDTYELEPGDLDEEVEVDDARHPCPLEQLNVTCLNMTLDRFSTDRKVDDEKFHLVTGDPSQLQLNGSCKILLDYQKVDKYVAIIRQLLLDHGWAFLYTRPVDYWMWDKAFRAHSFDPLEYAWPMVRDTDTIQMNTSPFPQNITELLIGARKKDAGKPQFQPDTTSIYQRHVSSRKRKFAILDNCCEPRLKLRKPNTREPLRTNQRSAEPVAEFVKTFSPPNGNVLDAFAETLETAKGCYMTGRNCVVLEPDIHCFEVSVQTLKESAAGYLEKHTPPPTEVTIPQHEVTINREEENGSTIDSENSTDPDVSTESCASIVI